MSRTRPKSYEGTPEDHNPTVFAITPVYFRKEPIGHSDAKDRRCTDEWIRGLSNTDVSLPTMPKHIFSRSEG